MPNQKTHTKIYISFSTFPWCILLRHAQASKPTSPQGLFAIPSAAPFPNPLCGPFWTRHLHTEPAPFSGPPSYATLARRFSASSPNPISFFAQKAAKEAIERGEFVDIHDIGSVDLKDYDVLITDMNNDTLHSEISKLVDIPYLQEATKEEADKVAREIRGEAPHDTSMCPQY